MAGQPYTTPYPQAMEFGRVTDPCLGCRYAPSCSRSCEERRQYEEERGLYYG